MSLNLVCNLADCRLPVTDKGWVTRCMHVFCPEHGTRIFAKKQYSSRMLCPICNEEIVIGTDALLCDSNQSDMFLAGLTPEKSLRMLAKSIKLWMYQLGADKKVDEMKHQHLLKKIQETKMQCDELLNEARVRHAKEVAELKTYCRELQMKCERATNDLAMAKKVLKQKSLERDDGFPPVLESSQLLRARNSFSPSLPSSRFEI